MIYNQIICNSPFYMLAISPNSDVGADFSPEVNDRGYKGQDFLFSLGVCSRPCCLLLLKVKQAAKIS